MKWWEGFYHFTSRMSFIFVSLHHFCFLSLSLSAWYPELIWWWSLQSSHWLRHLHSSRFVLFAREKKAIALHQRDSFSLQTVYLPSLIHPRDEVVSHATEIPSHHEIRRSATFLPTSHPSKIRPWCENTRVNLSFWLRKSSCFGCCIVTRLLKMIVLE